MKSKLFIAKLTMTSLAICLFFTSVEAVPVFADSFKSVTLGADLSEAQKQEMLKAFGVTKNSASILEVTSKEEHTYLAKVASEAQLGNKAISCSYVEPTEKGGLNVSTNNLTWVNDGMIKNALITAGIENANVKASAPFEVSGTAALTGILKGFENTSTGKKIDENKKEAANEELITTGDVGEKIGQNDASNLMNNIKKDVIKDKPKTKEELNKIVDKATNEYKDKLTDKDIENIRNVMSKINDLDLNYNNLKDQMNDITNQLKDKLNTKEAQGFFARLEEMFADFLDSVKSLF
ncbi:DUF1002 domain-containing protein [Clostridium sp. YIM B02555]|uniref:DUF1002 domain-containing protein n=1 Tax=Clostridium sp. YIM B02555 TaxID=2911968 RepID=UPI001EEDB1F8|nr:DUF1002 domain-containing protein [Clostridium sp. YIM B02555]